MNINNLSNEQICDHPGTFDERLTFDFLEMVNCENFDDILAEVKAPQRHHKRQKKRTLVCREFLACLLCIH